MTSDEEWIEDFCQEVRWAMGGMLKFEQKYADAIEAMLLEDPIKHEKMIRLYLNSFGGSVRLPSKRGANRGDDAVGFGRMVAWSCEDDKCKHNHCTQCGQCEARAGDGHSPWYSADLPACEPKPTSRKDRQEE